MREGGSRSVCGGALTLLDERRRDGACDFKVMVSRGLVEAPGWLVSATLAARPSLAEHSCTDDEGSCGIGGPTTMPHLLEHLAIDFLVQLCGDGFPHAGYTVWLDRKRAIARITLASEDHALTERALDLALDLLDDLWDRARVGALDRPTDGRSQD